MSDAVRRRIERDAERDPALASRVVVERLRAGLLSPEQARLLHYLGHAAASEVLGERPYPPGVRDLQARVTGLFDHGLPVAVRALTAVVRLLLPQFELERPGDRRPHAALAAALRYARAGTEEAAQAALLVAQPALDAARLATRSTASVFAAKLAGQAATLGWDGDVAPAARRAATTWASDLPRLGLRVEPLWQAIHDDLVAWTLGQDDLDGLDEDEEEDEDDAGARPRVASRSEQ